MREKVLAAFAIYAEGGTIARALRSVTMKHVHFYRMIRENPDLMAQYREIQRSRADMMADEIYGIGTDKIDDPRAARVAIEAREKVAGFYDRARFGQKVSVEIEAGPSLLDALTARQRELLQPPSDLTAIAHQQVIDVESTIADPARDKQSRAADQVADLTDPDDIFGP